MLELLWFDVILKAIVGATLFLFPLTVARVLGLDRPTSSFWPRLTGAIVLGITASILIGIYVPASRGSIGPAGLVAINLTSAAGLFSSLVLGSAAPSRRGRIFIAASALMIAILGFLELAHA